MAPGHGAGDGDTAIEATTEVGAGAAVIVAIMAAGALPAEAIMEPGEPFPDAGHTAVGTGTAMPVEADAPLAEVEPRADVASGAETHFMAADVALGAVGARSREVDTASVAAIASTGVEVVPAIASTEAVAAMVGGAGNIVLNPKVSRPTASAVGRTFLRVSYPQQS